MNNNIRLSLMAFGALTLLLSAVHDIADAQSCATAANAGGDAWFITDSSTGNVMTATLSQDSGGRITGTMKTDPQFFCPSGTGGSTPIVWTVGGISLGGGKFYFSGANNNTLGCSTAADFTITVNKPGCSTATGSWGITAGYQSGYEASVTAQHQCYYPDGENNTFSNVWGDSTPPDPTVAEFDAHVVPAFPSYDWGGRTVTETFPNPGSNLDTCYYPGSPYGNEQLLGGPTSLESGGGGYSDNIGPTAVRTNWYRQTGRAPCGYTYYQSMTIDCPTDSPVYIVNKLVLGIYPSTIDNSRTGTLGPATSVNTASAIETWGIPQSAYQVAVMQAIINLLLPSSPPK